MVRLKQLIYCVHKHCIWTGQANYNHFRLHVPQNHKGPQKQAWETTVILKIERVKYAETYKEASPEG